MQAEITALSLTPKHLTVSSSRFDHEIMDSNCVWLVIEEEKEDQVNYDFFFFIRASISSWRPK